jgi:hypothetical protein
MKEGLGRGKLFASWQPGSKEERESIPELVGFLFLPLLFHVGPQSI